MRNASKANATAATVRTLDDEADLTRRKVLVGAAGMGTIALAGAALIQSTTPARSQESLGGQMDMDEFLKAGTLPDMVTGKADAPVTLIEYASMTCPHCARFHNNVLGPIKEKYIDTGKVRLIMREFPLDNLATAGFMLARCAGPEKHYALTNVLYKEQATWAFSGGNPVPPLREIAKQAGFTRESFDKCLKDQELVNGIMEIRKRGSSEFNVTGTPALFLNGRRYTGNISVAGLSAAIDALLENG